MKQACSLESMVDAVLSEMKRRGNAKNTSNGMKGHTHNFTSMP